MLKATESTGYAANPKKTEGKSGVNSVVGDSKVGANEATNQTNSTKRKNQAKTTKFKILVKSKNYDFPPNFRNMKAGTGFFIQEARLVLTQLRQAFIEAPILHHLDPKCHIWIETNASRYVIVRILC